MKLYDSKGAPNPRRVRFFIAEKGIEGIEVQEVTIMKGEHKTPDYRKIAPNSRLPALELDDGNIILETSSICRYLEAIYPQTPLLGETPLDMATIDMWTRRAEFELMSPLAAAFRHTHPAMASLENQFPEFGKSNQAAAARGLKTFENLIGTNDFLLGNKLTNLDLTLLTLIDFFPRLSRVEFTQELHPNLVKWQERMHARPAIQSVQ